MKMSDLITDELAAAANALDEERPAEAAARLTHALAETNTPLEEETLLALRSYCAWLIGDWTDMPALIADFRRARQLQSERGKSSSGRNMLAAVAFEPGRLGLARVPVPEPLPGWVAICVRAFGLNRTEKFLEQGGWPVTTLSPVAPLVNGIECAGEVVANGPPIGDAPPLPVGTRVLACASSLGRGIDGTHAEYVVVPRWGVVAVPSSGADLSWRELAAIPMSFGTAAGSLDAMDCHEGDTVLVRGGTSALGLAAISLAKHVMGCTVLATTRRPSAEERLRAAGADLVLVEPDVRSRVRDRYPDGVDCALDCVGEATLKETMRCVRRNGVMCQTGALTHVPNFGLRLLGEVPSSVKVTCFESDVLTGAQMSGVVARVVEAVERVVLPLPLDPVEFTLDQYQDALDFLDSKARTGKVVVTVP